MQNQYNLLRRQDEPEMIAMCADMGVGPGAVLPAGQGPLARPWGEQSLRSTVDKVVKAFDSPLDKPVVNAVQRIAEARGATMAQVALAWVLTKPVVSAPSSARPSPITFPRRSQHWTSGSRATSFVRWKRRTRSTDRRPGCPAGGTKRVVG